MNNNDINNILKNSTGKINPQDVKKAMQNGDATSLINNLSPDDKQKLNNLLSDKKALEEVLKSPKAQALMKLFNKGKNNGWP